MRRRDPKTVSVFDMKVALICGVSGQDGALSSFADLDVKRKVFIHINTTNPILADDSAERAAVLSAGWEVSHDGMAIEL